MVRKIESKWMADFEVINQETQSQSRPIVSKYFCVFLIWYESQDKKAFESQTKMNVISGSSIPKFTL